METLGGLAILAIRGICWIALGIGTFNWIGVDSFGTAILWLFVWHLATVILSWVFIFIIGGIVSIFD